MCVRYNLVKKYPLGNIVKPRFFILGHLVFFYFLSFLYIVNIICLFDMEFVKNLFLFYMLSLYPNDAVLHHALAVILSSSTHDSIRMYFIILILMLVLMGFCSEFFFLCQ